MNRVGRVIYWKISSFAALEIERVEYSNYSVTLSVKNAFVITLF